mgnify:CR=1 FL=1
MEKDRNGETALHKAALRGHVDLLRLFMEKTDKSTNGLTQAVSSKRARNRNWDTLRLFTTLLFLYHHHTLTKYSFFFFQTEAC